MTKEEFWKNFAMGRELEISGCFIYDGITKINKMYHFMDDEESFMILYNLSIGIERLQKVLIVLQEDDIENIETFEKNLITYSHTLLQQKINEKTGIILNKVQNSFLNMLSNFYKEVRYDRFLYANCETYKSKKLLTTFLNRNLNISIEDDGPLQYDMLNQIKKFIGKIVGGISRLYFKKIVEKCHELNIYTYELSPSSPAYSVFYTHQANNNLNNIIQDKHIAIKELIIELINTKEENEFMKFIKSIPPIGLDPALYNEYLEDLVYDRHSDSLIDEVETIYQDEEINISERLGLLDCVGNSRIVFDDEDDDESDNAKQRGSEIK